MVIPTIVFSCVYLLLFMSSHFIAKVDEFVVGTIIGFITGCVTQYFLRKMCRKPDRVQQSDESKLLKDNNFSITGSDTEDEENTDGQSHVEIELHTTSA